MAREWSVTLRGVKSGWERDVEIHKGWDLCWCGGGGGVGGNGVVMRVMVLIVVVGIVMLMGVRVLWIGVVGVVGVSCVGVSCVGALEVDCAGVIDILVLAEVFVVEVAEGVELVVGCVVRLVLWCVNRSEYFLCCFSRKLVEMNRLSVGVFLFGMVIWADCFVLSEQGFLGKMVGTDVLMYMVVEFVVVEAVDVIQAGCFVFSNAVVWGI